MDTLQQLRLTLLVLLPLAAAVAALLGYLLIARMLRPLARITSTAAAISPSDLSQRLGVLHGGDEVGRLAATFDAMLDRLEDSFDTSSAVSWPMPRTSCAHRSRRCARSSRSRAVGRAGPTSTSRHSTTSTPKPSASTPSSSDLLELARGDAGRFEAPQRVDLSELLRDVVASLDIVAQARGLELVGEIDDGLAMDGDGDALVRLLVNLVDNAIKYTDAGAVTVTASRRADAIEIEVVDTGRGIADVDLPHVFERFYRGDSSRSSEGTGLGLAVAQEIAGAHGGTIRLAAHPGGGTSCRVTLPPRG